MCNSTLPALSVRRSFLTSLLLILLSDPNPCHAKLASEVTPRSKLQAEPIWGLLMSDITQKLSKQLAKVTDEELGIPAIQDMYTKYKYTSVLQDASKVLRGMAVKLEAKLNESVAILNRTSTIIERYVKVHSGPLQSRIVPCSDVGNSEPNSTTMYSDSSPENLLLEEINNAKKLEGAIKQFYLLSTSDVESKQSVPIEDCRVQDRSLLWKTYQGQLVSVPRNIMLLLDHGGSLSKRQFQIVKGIAKQMILVSGEEDRIGVLAISDEWTSPYLSEQCLMPNLVPPTTDSHVLSRATEHNKLLLNKFIDSLAKGSGVTNHSLGFQQALETIRASNISSNETVMLLYISRGLLSSLTEAKTVLQTISFMLEDIDNPIIINTCAVIDESKPIMYETHFLRDIADQNYTKYNVDVLEEAERGIMLEVNSSHSIGLSAARFYNMASSQEWSTLSPRASLPVWDNISKDLCVSVSLPLPKRGLVGLDIYLSSIAEDITYYSSHFHVTYAFLITTEGVAIMHPSYPRPASIWTQPKYVDIMHLEKVQNFSAVRKLMLSKEEGHHLHKSANDRLSYSWKRVGSFYVIVIVVREDVPIPSRPFKVNFYPVLGSGSRLVHHRLDIFATPNICRYLNQVATLDAGSLYLSASCFQSPFIRTDAAKEEATSPLTVQSYMAYLKDNTRLLANPGLKEEVRDDVAALAHIIDFLRTQHLTGARTKYIVRRYVTSPTGVLQVFPGGFVAPGFEPTRRSWYLKAVEHRRNTVLSPPYLDAGGAGYIVTLAYATEHVVVAMDVTYGYVYKLMLEQMPFCREKNCKCFMMDDKGYLIYHPNLIDPNGHGPIEQQHIIHKESLVANDILNHKHFVKKMLCNNYADGTIQRYYNLNSGLEEVLVNAVYEHCVRYQVTTVENTNVFIGMVNTSCEVVATFCPCSMVDRLCLNCNRMEQKECECPCECPLNLNTCMHPNRTFMENPICDIQPEQTVAVSSHLSKDHFELDTCLPIFCEYQLTYESCLGVLGCSWCQYDVDGESLLANAFCTSFMTCFNGVLGSVTPYGDAMEDSASSTDLMDVPYSPTGPIIASIIGASIILALLFFCYRSYNSNGIERFYLTSAQENQVRMSDFNMSDDFPEMDSHQDKLLQDTNKLEPISPYCIATNYRRPLTAVDSDHGYSTMTPHDESEHFSFAPVEIDSLEDDCTSDATSINTSVSSKHHKVNELRHKVKAFPQTDVQMMTTPSRNCIIAPVTVHRNMEVTQ